MDRETRIEPQRARVLTKEARADPMECAGPFKAFDQATRAFAQHLARDALDPTRHLGGGAAREGQHQDAARVSAVDQVVRHTVRQRVGLARASARDDEERAGRSADPVRRRRLLRGVQSVEIAAHWNLPACPRAGCQFHCLFASAGTRRSAANHALLDAANVWLPSTSGLA